MPNTLTTLTLSEIPFYKAVEYFEKDNIAEALPLFITCALRGNIYACHYIQHLLPLNQPHHLTPEQAAFINPIVFTTMFNELPTDFMPDSWLKTSLIKKSEWLAQPPAEQEKTLIKLNDLAQWNGNAFIYLQEIIKSQPELIQRIKTFKPTLSILHLRVADLYSILKNNIDLGILLLENSEKKGDKDLVNSLNQEIDLCHKNALLGHKYHGNLERLIAKTFYTIKPHERGIKDMPRSRRCLKWQKAGALMGDRELQYMFSKDEFDQLKDIKDPTAWLLLAAKKGNPPAMMYAFIHFNNQSDITKAADWLKKFTQEKIKELLENNLIHKEAAGSLFFSLGEYTKNNWGGFSFNFDQALAHYTHAHQLAHAESALAIGKLYFEKGHPTHPNSYQKLAIQWLEKALLTLDKTSAHLAYEPLALIYFDKYLSDDGESSQNITQTRKYFELVSKNHDFLYTRSPLNFAQILFETTPTTEWNKAFNYCEQILQNKPNNHHAALLWGQYNLHGLTPDYEKAKQRLLVASEKFPQALDSIAKYALQHKQYEDAMNYATQGYHQKNTTKKSLYAVLLGLIYENQLIPNVSEQESLTKACEYYKESLHTKEGLSNYGVVLMTLGSINPNTEAAKKQFSEAEKAFLKSIDMGWILANFNLSTLYNQHSVVMGLTPDPQKSFKYLKDAGSLSDPDVHHDLGFSYHKGHGCPQDKQKAKKHYELAIAFGSPLSCVNLVGILLSDEINKENMDVITLKTCEKLLDQSSEHMKNKNISGSIGKISYYYLIFTKGIMQLIINPNALNSILKKWETALKSDQADPADPADPADLADLADPVYRKKIQKTHDFLKNLPKGKPPAREFFISLLLDKNIVLQSLEPFDKIEQTNAISSTEKTKNKLLTRLNNFINQPLNKVSVTDFKKIIKSEAAKTLFAVKLDNGRAGSREKYEFKTENDTVKTAGFHDLHGHNTSSPGQLKAIQNQAKYLRDLAEKKETKQNQP